MAVTLLSIVCTFLSCSYLHRVWMAQSQSSYIPSTERGVFDNIGYKDLSDKLVYPPMDVVYTWVNGSDPAWLKEKNYYKGLYNKEYNITSEETVDSATSDNRFRDNDELKFASCVCFIAGTVFVLWREMLPGSATCSSSQTAKFPPGWIAPTLE